MKQGMSRRSGGKACKKAIALIVLCMNAFSCLTAPAGNPMLLAQAGDASPNASLVEFNIAPQSLTDALHEFAATTGLQVSYRANLASGLTSPCVSGSRTPKDALETLLTGTGLQFRFANNETVTLERGTSMPALPGAPPRSQAPSRSNEMTAKVQDIHKPIKVPEIVVKEVRERAADATNYVAEDASTATRTDTPLIQVPQSIEVVRPCVTVKTFRTWYLFHKWTSLLCTIFLLLLCLTGLPLIFSDDLAVWLGEAVEPPEHVTTTTPVILESLISDARERRPLDHVKFLIRDEDHPAWFVSLGTTPTAQDNSALFMYDARTGALLHDRPDE